MPVRVEIHSDPAFVEAVYTGPLPAGEMLDAIREITDMARTYGTNLRLADLSALSGTLSIVNLYAMAAALAFERRGRSIRHALVVPDLPSLGEAVQYWEAACQSRGLAVRAFRDRAAALAWLLDPASAP